MGCAVSSPVNFDFFLKLTFFFTISYNCCNLVQFYTLLGKFVFRDFCFFGQILKIFAHFFLKNAHFFLHISAHFFFPGALGLSPKLFFGAQLASSLFPGSTPLPIKGRLDGNTFLLRVQKLGKKWT